MAESIGLKIVILLIGVVTLATDVARLALDWSPAHTRRGTVIGQGGDQKWYGPAWERQELGAGFPQRRTTPLDPPGARGPPRDPWQTGPPPFSQPRPDLSIYHRGCVTCRETMPRLERRDFREWCSACHLLRS